MQPTAYPSGVALLRINSQLPEPKRMSRDQFRDFVAKGRISAFRTTGGHLRFTDSAIRAAILTLTGPAITVEDFTSFAGACEADEHVVIRAHKLGAELAMMPSRAEQLRHERQAIIEDLRTRSAAAAAEGRHDLAWSLSSRASALQASAYTVIGGVVHVTTPPGGIAPNMSTEIIPEDDDDRDG